MRSTFFKLFLVPAMAVAAALVSQPAHADSLVNVPFNFSAMGKAFPAGSYVVERDSRGAFVSLRSKDASKRVTSVLGPGSPQPGDLRIILRFETDGESYTLKTIQYHGMTTAPLPGGNMRNRERQSRTIVGQGE